MKTIPLTKGKFTLVDDEDYELVSKRKWHAHGDNRDHWCATTWIDGRLVRMHRQIMERILGRPLLSDEHVDHVDGNELNNQRCNLRLATPSQNQINRRKQQDSSSKYTGVSWDTRSEKWRAYFTVDGKEIHVGYFAAEIDAAKARDEAIKARFPEFASLNFEDRPGRTSAIGIPLSKLLTKKRKDGEPTEGT